MKSTLTRIREVVTSEILVNVDGFSIAKANANDCIRSRCNVDGHDWEIRLYPALHFHDHDHSFCTALQLVFIGESRTSVTATLSGKIKKQSSNDDLLLKFKESTTVPKAFNRHLDRSLLLHIGVSKVKARIDDFTSLSLMVECTITVFREPAAAEGTIPVPSSDLTHHLGDLLRSQAAADVSLSVSGECFAAHKSVLAARSPVFMAEFFAGSKKEEDYSQRVVIEDMDVAVFEALLHFIYTDMVPYESDNQKEAVNGMVMAQHLLVAADRFGLDRLKVMAEHRLSLSVSTGTVASTLALAEQFNCSHLKAKCVGFVCGGSSKTLDAIMATEGYRHLEMSSPSSLTELLQATHRNKRSRLADA